MLEFLDLFIDDGGTTCEYRELDLERIKSLMRVPLFIDLRNVYSPQRMQSAGFEYVGGCP